MLVIRGKQLEPHLTLFSKFHSRRMIESNKTEKMMGKKSKGIKWDASWLYARMITSFKTREPHAAISL